MELSDEPGGPEFDDAFIAGASIQEPSAEQRARQARIDAAHRQLIEDARQNQAVERKGLRRQHRQARRRGRVRKVAVVVVLVVLVGAAYWSTRPRAAHQQAVSFRGDVAATPATAAAAGHVSHPTGASGATDSIQSTTTSSLNIQGGQPPAGVGEQAEPLGQPAAPPAATGPFKFLQTQAGSTDPIAYDPCRPIHVVFDDRTSPPGGDALVRAAMARASYFSGFQFVFDGTTTETPSMDRSIYLPDRYPGRWAPVLVAWTDPQETPVLAGDVAGYGGSAGVDIGSTEVLVSGSIMLDGPQLAEIQRGPNGPAEVQATIEHEVGHLLGLAHVNDPTQIMNPVGNAVTDYAAGDQLGLETLGRSHCYPQV